MIFYKIEFGILKGKILGPDILYELTMYEDIVWEVGAYNNVLCVSDWLSDCVKERMWTDLSINS